jgi:hypothetical protein
VHAVNLVAPHSLHELFYEGWASWRAGAAVLRAGVAAQTALASGEGLRTSVTPTLGVSVGLAPGWSTSAALVAPAAGQGFFGWGTSLAVTRTFGGPGCEGVVP